jgi:hypothetical protein
MKSKFKVLVRPGRIRSRRVWLIYFRYNENLIARIKLKFKAQWCAELKCWWIDDQEGFIQELKSWNEIAVLQSKHIYKNNKVMLIQKVHCNSFGKKRNAETKPNR